MNGIYATKTPEWLYNAGTKLREAYVQTLVDKFFPGAGAIDLDQEQKTLGAVMSLYKSLRITSDFMYRWLPDQPIELRPVQIGGVNVELSQCKTVIQQMQYLAVLSEDILQRDTGIIRGKLDLDTVRHSAVVNDQLILKGDERYYPHFVDQMITHISQREKPLTQAEARNPDLVSGKIMAFMWAVPEPDAGSHPGDLGVVRADKIKTIPDGVEITMTPTVMCAHLPKLQAAIQKAAEAAVPEGFLVKVSIIDKATLAQEHIFQRKNEWSSLTNLVTASRGNSDYFRRNLGFMMNGGVIPGAASTPGQTQLYQIKQ